MDDNYEIGFSRYDDYETGFFRYQSYFVLNETNFELQVVMLIEVYSNSFLLINSIQILIS